MTKISIIMPIYNMETFLDRSISSVLGQSMEEIELICIDDSSNDSSVEKIREYEQKDRRVCLLQNDTRKSALHARKRGILTAQGKYIMFLDADDYLEPDACSILYKKMENAQVDILHFPACIENEGVTLQRQNNMKSFVRPYQGELKGEEVFTKCFGDQWYRFSIWNKIYRTDVCKRAMAAIEDDFLLKANDMILYTAISLCVQSYVGTDGEPLYHYSFGSGSTGSSNLTLEQFEVYCYEAKAARLFRQIVEKHDVENQYEDVIHKVKENLLRDCIYNWKSNLSEDKAPAGFDLLVRYWGVTDIVAGLANAYSTGRAKLISRIYGAECLTARKRTIKTLGIYYHRMGKGGVQRVISLLLPLYLEMGYQVVLFTDEYEPEVEYEIPPQVKRIVLSSALTISYADYGVRAKEITKAMVEYKIDVMLYQASECRTLVYDMLLVKGMGIPFCVCVHGLFSAELLNSNALIREKIKTFKVVDRLIVLSETEKTFWEIFGIPATYIPNPIQEMAEVEKTEEYILWLGRLESITKQHMDAINIMNKVVKVHPDARMKIVGNEVTHDARKNMLKRIATLKLENNIEVCDYSINVEDYYRTAKIFLVTSATESFSMTVVESKGYGIPLVTYEMPYLETLKDKKGYLSVPQNDLEGAAGAIIQLIEDEELRRHLGKEARESYENLRTYPLLESWRKVLEEVGNAYNTSVSATLEREKLELVVETLLEHYQKGSERIKGQLAGAKKPVVTMTAAMLQYIEPQDSYSKVRKIYVKFYNLYVHYRKHGAAEAWRVIRNKLRR